MDGDVQLAAGQLGHILGEHTGVLGVEVGIRVRQRHVPGFRRSGGGKAGNRHGKRHGRKEFPHCVLPVRS